jgi:apolipoprotein N-acyltransferase
MLTVTDPLGRVVAESRSAPMPGTTLVARLPASDAGARFYTVSGDAFGWLCVVP